MEKEDEKIRCEKCGRFVKVTAYSNEGSSEMLSCKCSCGNEWSEGY